MAVTGDDVTGIQPRLVLYEIPIILVVRSLWEMGPGVKLDGGWCDGLVVDGGGFSSLLFTKLALPAFLHRYPLAAVLDSLEGGAQLRLGPVMAITAVDRFGL